MSCPRTGPCEPFVTQLDLCCLVSGTTFADPCIAGTDQPVPQEIIDNAIQAASEILWAATGRQFGKCTVTIRPCQDASKGCDPCPGGGELPGISEFGYGGGFPWYPMMTENGWINVRPCGCNNSCGCSELCEQILPEPVCCVEEVKINGISLAPALYRVDDFRKLVRLAGDMNVEDLTSANPDVVVVGPGAAQSPLGIQLPNDSPDQYTVQLGGNRRGVTFDLVWGPGVSGTIAAFGIAGGEWDYSIISGNPTVTRLSQTLTVGPPQDAGSNAVIRIRMKDPGTITDFIIEKNLGGQPLFLRQVAWIDETTATGDRCWPECQDLSVDDTHENTYSITVTFGKEPPALIKLAASSLACELIKSCVGQPCMLPQRVQSISRQGITIGMLDPMDFLKQGSTGIYIVELARNTFNPNRLMRNSRVFSIDRNPLWRRTDTAHDC